MSSLPLSERTFDRVYKEDWRSLNFRSAPEPGRRPRSYTHRCDWWLDQLREGACVGFGLTHRVLSRPERLNLGTVEEATTFARKAYKEGQKIDEWPGEGYEGTSVLAGMKVLESWGYVSEYRWCLTMEDLIWTAGCRPVVIGVNWYEGMADVDSNGFIRVTGDVQGGHCLLLNGVRVVRTDGEIDYDKSYFRLHNSWGKDWGVNGECFISFRDMERLMQEQGDFAVPVLTKKKV